MKKKAPSINHTEFQNRSHKPYPVADQKGQNVYPISDQNSSKTITFGAAHTYLAYIREYPLPLDILTARPQLFKGQVTSSIG